MEGVGFVGLLFGIAKEELMSKFQSSLLLHSFLPRLCIATNKNVILAQLTPKIEKNAPVP